MIITHALIAIALVLILIIWRKWDPVIALVIGCLYLGIAGGVSVLETITAIASGFGDIMVSVGLLIGFGVLLGALMYSLGALQRLVEVLLRALGPRRLPYALSAALTTVCSSIYVDVQLVLTAPLARGVAPRIHKHNGLPMMGATLGAGIFAGYVFVVPGLGALTIAGQLDLELGKLLLLGLMIGPLTAILTPLLYKIVFLRSEKWWKPAKDEHVGEALRAQEEQSTESTEDRTKWPSLFVALLPIIVPMILIAAGAIAGAIVPKADREALAYGELINTVAGKPFANLALFIGLLGAYLLARGTIGKKQADKAVERGLNTTGQILLITGIGGSLGAVIEATTLDDVLGEMFSNGGQGVSAIVALLFAWFVAALLHFAIGSVSVAGIAAAGILAPIAGSLGVNPVVLGLAIGSGALFAVQLNSNFFWMFQSMLGLTTQGAMKTLTVVTCMLSLVSLPMVLIMGVLVPIGF